MVEGDAVKLACHAVTKRIAFGSGIVLLVITGNVTAGGIGTNEMLGTSSGTVRSRYDLKCKGGR